MSSICLPCDTIARLSVLCGEAPFDAIRLDQGRVIATNRHFAAVERVAHFAGVAHLRITPALIEQCKTETQYGSTLTVTCNEMLQWTTAATSLGWQSTENLFAPDDPLFDEWHTKIVTPCIDPEPVSGHMTVNADQLATLAQCSPSGTVTFESHINPARPTVVRDANSAEWVGFFLPRIDDGVHHPAATVPGWLR